MRLNHTGIYLMIYIYVVGMVKQKMLVKSKRDMRHKAIISYQTLVIMVGYQKVA